MLKLLSILIGFLLSASAIAGDFTLSSSAFKDQGSYPVLYTCAGDNISPPLTWSNPPAGTKSYVLIFSVTSWQEVYLWALYNLPKETRGLEQAVDLYALPAGTKVGTNFFGENAYHGSCPPDTSVHKYIFTLYALDTLLYPVEDEIDPAILLRIIKPHILKKTELTVFYSHQ